MRAVLDVFMSLLLLGSTVCLHFADKAGILPIFSSERFARIRPKDAAIAHFVYKTMIVAIMVALLLLALTEGIFASLLCLPLALTTLLFTSFLTRLILEVVLALRVTK